MGWRYRRSMGLGPFRVNLSRSGIGYSAGVPGFRVGVRSNGRAYRSMGIPGSGLYRIDDLGKRGASGAGCALVLLVPFALWAIVRWLA